jgi:hypothetical protein
MTAFLESPLGQRCWFAVRWLLLLVAALLIVLPDLRVAPLRAVLLVLYLGIFGVYLWQLRRLGILGKSPRQILHADRRPAVDLLTFSALMAGTLAIFVMGG